MNVLITGATGLVGGRLVKLCLEAGMIVHYLTTSKEKIKTYEENYKGFYWNPEEGEIDENAIRNVKVIIHLAGASIAQKWTKSNIKKIKKSRIKSAQLLLETITRCKEDSVLLPVCQLQHFISASAVGGYPSSLTEEYSEAYPKYAKSFLGEVVEAWESAATAFGSLGVKVSILRLGIVLDPNDGAFPKMANPIKKGVGAILGSGKQWQSWIHSVDVARLFFYVLQHQLEGTYNAVAPAPVTNKELTQIIAKQLNKTIYLPSVPPFVLKLLLGEMATIVLESQKISAQKIIDARFDFYYETVEQKIKLKR